MVKSPKLSYYKNSIVLTFVANQLDILNTHNLPVIETQKTALKTAYEVMAQSFQKDVGSIKTEDLKDLDKRRDDAIRGITLVASGYELHPNEAKSNAGAAILRSIRKYAKNIIQLSYQEETAIIRDIINNWTKDAQLTAAVATLDLTDWQTELAAANDAFDTMYIDRNKEIANRQAKVSTKEAREAVEQAIQTLWQHLSAHLILNPATALDQLVTEVNQLTEKYNLETARRRTRDGEGSSTDDPEEDLEVGV